MNNTQGLCSDQLLLELIDDRLAPDQQGAMLDHIEHCDQCRSRMEALSASEAQWRKTVEVLSDSGPDSIVPMIARMPSASMSESLVKSMLAPPSHPEMLGRLGRYEVERLVGTGGMGVVFKAFDTELNRPVAIKVLAPHLASCGSARQRFAREARAAAAVVNEHVVPIHNVEIEGETPFLVMKYIDGESLQARLDRDGPLELDEILRIGMQVAAGLAAAHQQGLVHRDIKPANILLEHGLERALITDFGLARAADDAHLTQSGFHAGTPQYMSPEQVTGQAVDCTSDLFSLGSVIYAMCTGRPPFRAENSFGVMKRIAEDVPRSIQEINPRTPDWLECIVSQLLAKRIEVRLHSASEASQLLSHCLKHVQHPASSSLPTAVVTWMNERARSGPEQIAHHNFAQRCSSFFAKQRRLVAATVGWPVADAFEDKRARYVAKSGVLLSLPMWIGLLGFLSLLEYVPSLKGVGFSKLAGLWGFFGFSGFRVLIAVASTMDRRARQRAVLKDGDNSLPQQPAAAGSEFRKHLVSAKRASYLVAALGLLTVAVLAMFKLLPSASWVTQQSTSSVTDPVEPLDPELEWDSAISAARALQLEVDQLEQRLRQDLDQ